MATPTLPHDRRARLHHRLLAAAGLGHLVAACSAPAREPAALAPADPVTSPPASSAPPPPVAAVPTATAAAIVALPDERCAPAASVRAPASRPVPVAAPPRNDHQPTVEVNEVCAPPAVSPPPSHYPAPYDRCPVAGGPSGGQGRAFSACLTDEARRSRGDVCCYRVTVVHHAGRPLRLGSAGTVAAPLTGRAWEPGAGLSSNRA